MDTYMHMLSLYQQRGPTWLNQYVLGQCVLNLINLTHCTNTCTHLWHLIDKTVKKTWHSTWTTVHSPSKKSLKHHTGRCVFGFQPTATRFLCGVVESATNTIGAPGFFSSAFVNRMCLFNPKPSPTPTQYRVINEIASRKSLSDKIFWRGLVIVKCR